MRLLRSWLGLLGTLALPGLPAPATAQPIGSEFQVNTYTTGHQVPRFGNTIAADANGNFVVVWFGQGEGDGDGIFGRRFDSAGEALGTEFRVNAFTSGNQSWATVAAAAGGDFVVVWQGVRAGTGEIFGQRYESGGQPQGDEFRVNSYTDRLQRFPAVASDASGNFVVVWDGSGPGDANGIFGQRYDGAGARLGGEFRVNSYTTGSQYFASVAADESGNFVVVWERKDVYGGLGAIFGQRYDSEGHPLGAEFLVPAGVSYQTGFQVASDPAGNFVVVWSSYYRNYNGIFGQRYDNAGVPQGGKFRVHTSNPRLQRLATDVAYNSDGNFVVVWNALNLDGSGYGVFGRSFDSAGVPQSEQFQINAFTTGDQGSPSVSAKGPNEFVVAWFSDGQDGNGASVFGRRVLNPAGQAGGRVEDQRTRTQSSASAAKR